MMAEPSAEELQRIDAHLRNVKAALERPYQNIEGPVQREDLIWDPGEEHAGAPSMEARRVAEANKACKHGRAP